MTIPVSYPVRRKPNPSPLCVVGLLANTKYLKHYILVILTKTTTTYIIKNTNTKRIEIKPDDIFIIATKNLGASPVMTYQIYTNKWRMVKCITVGIAMIILAS